MSKKTTNVLGIVITIFAGTFFNVLLCNSCTSVEDTSSVKTTVIIKNGTVTNKM